MIQNGYIHVVEFTSGSMTISAGKSTVCVFASPFSSLQWIFPWYYECWKTRYREEGLGSIRDPYFGLNIFGKLNTFV